MNLERFDSLGEIHFDENRQDGIFAEEKKEDGPNAQGFLVFRNVPLTRVGVFKYSDGTLTWGELRTEREVFAEDSMRSFENAVVTDDHPEKFVTPDNVKDVQAGHGGSKVFRDGDFLKIDSLTITDPHTIQKIRDGKQELSCGYTVQHLLNKGMHEDGPHEFEHTKIRGNHYAVVDRGRAGPHCRLPTEDAQPMDKKVLEQALVDAKKLADEQIKTLEEKDAELKKAREDLEALQPLPPKKEDAEDPEKGKLAAKVDVLETELQEFKDGETSRVSARVDLVSKVSQVLQSCDSTQSDEDLKKSVIVHVFPSKKDTLDAKIEAKGAGYLDGLFEAAFERHQKDQKDIQNGHLDEISSGSMNDDWKDTLVKEYNDRANTQNTEGEGK